MAMISMLIGLLTAFFIYNDAKKRGHGLITAILWSVASIVVPYVMLPLYLVIGRKTKERNHYNDNDIIDIEATVVEETIRCIRCGGKLQEDFVVCPYCQEPLSNSKKDN